MTKMKEMFDMFATIENMMITEINLIKTNKRRFHQMMGAHAGVAKFKYNINPDIVYAYTECVDACYYCDGEEKAIEFIESTMETVKKMKETFAVMNDILKPEDENNETNVDTY